MKAETQIETGDNEHLAETSMTTRIQRFYDLSSPYYLKIYGEHIHDGYYITGKESRKEAQDNLVKLLVEKAKIKQGSRVLDVGCGIGGSSIWMAKNLGAATIGITISPVQVEIARRLAQEERVNSRFLLMNAEKMDFPETFDVLWVMAMLTHLSKPEEVLERADRFLNKHGKFIIFDWMPHESVADPPNDPYIRPVAEGMLLSSLLTLNSLLAWFIGHGYRINYSEDITDPTIKTWDDALLVIKDPAAWKIIPRASLKEVREFISFLKSVGKMKLAMQKGKLIAGAIVAEKI